jgi:hypothetical protein
MIRELAEKEDEDEVDMPTSGPVGSTIKAVPRSNGEETPRSDTRPPMTNRHSIQVIPDSSPFLVDPTLFPLPVITPPSTDAHPAGLAMRRPSKSADSVPGRSIMVDIPQIVRDEEEREDVGRKREGVLWGAGTWEEVGKGGKVKWEKYWVVLDHSSIYEVSRSVCFQSD